MLLFLASFFPPVFGKDKEWNREEIDLRIGGKTRIKSIKYPKDKPIPTRKRKKKAEEEPSQIQRTSSGGIVTNVVNSPPVDGFIPWIAVTTTNKGGDEMDFVARPESSITGTFTAANPQRDYTIGIFDTGASATIMSYAAANTLKLYGSNPETDLVTNNYIDVSGVTGSVPVYVTYPLGLFVDGLGAIDDFSGILYTSGMKGESNTSIIVGDDPGTSRPDLPTAVGTPLSVYYTTTFNNEIELTRIRDSNGIVTSYTAPDIHIYEPGDSRIPDYGNSLPLELRPLSALNVQYVLSMDALGALFGDIMAMDFSTPGSPSVIMGSGSQSVFFVHSVDLYEGSKKASDKNRFMLDTGAQVTVIGNRMGARLGLDHNRPDFVVEIQGVTGDIEDMPGFYLDKLEMPALGQWLTFTDVPVVLLDVASPEGGTLDGIIGMNLFVEYNLVLKGGGIFLTDDPALEFQRIGSFCDQVGDIAPAGGDCVVNMQDLLEVTNQWMQASGSANIAPIGAVDNIVNLLDLAVVAEHWLEYQ
jgi:hypothetical protein